MLRMSPLARSLSKDICFTLVLAHQHTHTHRKTHTHKAYSSMSPPCLLVLWRLRIKVLFCKTSLDFLLKSLVCRTATKLATFLCLTSIAGKARQGKASPGLHIHLIGLMQALQHMSISTINVTYRMSYCRLCLTACSRKNMGFFASDENLKVKVSTPALMAISCVTGENHSTSLYSDTDRELHL